MRKVLAAALLCMLTTGTACAGYAYPTPPASWGGSAGAWTYGGTAAANAPWINGSAAAQVTTSVAGRSITVPASMRLAANAGSVVARAVLTNPAMRLAPMLTWAAAALWVYDSINDRFTVPDGTGEGYAPGFYEGWNNTHYTTREAAARSVIMGECARDGDSCTIISIEVIEGIAHITYAKNGNPPTTTTRQPGYWNSPGCYNLSTGLRIGYVGSGCAAGGTREATQADADALAEAHPMPDAVAQAADDVMPLPQALPELEPVAEPIGVPYERNGEPWQDRAVVEPRNDESAPWRVDQRVEAAPVDSGSPSTPQEQQPTFCESNPSSIACQAMDVPAQQDIAQSTRNVAVTPQSGWGADNAACPAARHITAGGHDIPIPFDMFCTYFGWLRYIIIAFAWLGAGFILLGRID